MAQHYNSLSEDQFLNSSFLKKWEQKLSNIGERYLVEGSLYEFFRPRVEEDPKMLIWDFWVLTT